MGFPVTFRFSGPDRQGLPAGTPLAPLDMLELGLEEETTHMANNIKRSCCWDS